MPITSVNPATGETLQTYDELTDGQVADRITRAATAFARHRRTSPDERAARLARAADILEAEADQLGRIMTLEMGKPIGAAVAEARKCAWACRYYVENGVAQLADRPVETDADRAFVRFLPIGPVLAIMPWNFPFWQVFRFAAPALMAGNVGLLKHASNVPQCALAIEDVLRRAGFDGDEFQTLLIGVAQVAQVIDDPRVRAVTLTGSTPAGSAVAAQAGRLIKKTVLELGGSDPFIVMPSADLEKAAETAVRARVINNGQSCIAAKRFIVHEEIFDLFLPRFVERMRNLRVGDPLDPETQIGPLATPAIRDGVHDQVMATAKAGGRILCGGEKPSGAGNFYPPTVLTDIPEGSPAWEDEIFGPVAAMFRVADADQAVRLANATSFGLGSSVWTRDPEEQQRFINDLDAGLTYVNALVASDPRLPFGGVKASGYGRELSEFGIHEFVNIKAVQVAR